MLGAMPYLLAGFFYLVGMGIGGENALKNFVVATGYGEAFLYMLVGSAVLLVILVGLDSVIGELYRALATGWLELLMLTRTDVYIYMFGLTVPYFVANVGITILSFLPAAVYLSGLFAGLRLVVALLILFVGIIPLQGVSLIVATLVIRYKEPEALTQPVRAFLVVLSGSIYPIYILPSWMQLVARVLPPYYVSEAMRVSLMLSNPHLTLYYLGMLLLLTFFYYPAGLGFFKRFETIAKKSGELSKV